MPSDERLRALLARTLGRPAGSNDLNTPLAQLGIDSLQSVELLAALEEETGATRHPDSVTGRTTVRDLATPLDDTGTSDSIDERLATMLADSVLPTDVIPGHALERRSLLECKTVLLTGATGFLGGQLALDLLQRSRATLYCLVRPGDASQSRLRARLAQSGLERAALDRRLIAIEGDLSQPDLGLTGTARRHLRSRLDAIVHAGAAVNWIAPYEQLRATNVLGTLALLRLACGERGIPFHFVSSLSACYAAGGVSVATEQYDSRPGLRTLHLGYARTKAVAEALVLAAGTRGLPVAIYRPSLISGHSHTGNFNGDDLLSLLLRGCIAMRCAPDLDWSLDCEPVDVVSAEILTLSGENFRIAHLKHPAPRHWRECLLWMRLSGYDLRLVTYGEWLRRLGDELHHSRAHPLAALRPFLTTRYDGLTLPELYEDCRRTHVDAARTDAILAGRVDRPALDAALLHRYFAAYREAGYLPAPPSGAVARARRPQRFDAAFFTAAFAARGRAVSVQSVRCLSSGSAHSVIGELTAWQSGHEAGIHRYELALDTGTEYRTEHVVLKVKPPADDAIAVGEALAALCSRPVEQTYRLWRDQIGLAGSHLRERVLYEHGPAGLTRWMPALLGVAELDARGSCALVLEDLTGARLLDSVRRTPHWRAEDIATAIDGLAAIHAATYGSSVVGELKPALGVRRSTATTAAMSDLWSALAGHAAAAFAAWGGPDLPPLQRALIDGIDVWRHVMDAGPAAIVHHDCNPRNLCIRDRGELCAYDWELAAIAIPQRDLAEFLCFVLPAGVPGDVIESWIEFHRAALSRRSGIALGVREWRTGLAASLNDFLIDRLAMYALIHRVRAQAFLPRVIATWRHLHAHVGRMAAE